MEGQVNMMIENKGGITKKSVAFLTLGCKVNSYETDGMEKLFREAGYEIREFHEKADIYVVNTCTVTNIADRKSRQMLHKAKKINPEGIVAAVGCYAQASKDVLEADMAIDIVIGNNQKKNIIKVVEEFLRDNEKREVVIDIDHDQEYEELSIDSVGEKTRAYIKIQDGCNQFCSYCIIPYARGRVRSRKEEAVLEEAKRLAALGYQEVVLTGIHLSSYGSDSNESGKDYQEVAPGEKYFNEKLLSLIIETGKIEGIQRIRLGSLEPRIITEKFVKELAAQTKICPHFHLSLQSGCNETLLRMNRRYTTEEFEEKCVLLRKYYENPAITTDVIVGFPGETEEEFQICKKFLKKIKFAQMHIFKYSKRKGTKAESMTCQIDETIKNERSHQLIQLDLKLNQEYKNQFMGRIEKILVEEKMVIKGNDYYVGHNEKYQKIAFASKNNSINCIVQGKITGALTDEILLCKRID